LSVPLEGVEEFRRELVTAIAAMHNVIRAGEGEVKPTVGICSARKQL
jgi:hypothetical protein